MNHSTSENKNEVSRRSFFQLTLGWLASTFAVAASAAGAVRFLVPNVLYEPSLRFKAGKPDDYPDGSVTFMEDERVFLVRQGNTFRCLSAICTHLGCITAWKPELGIIACPCHGSKFNKDGTKIAGPAPRPLPRLKMWVSDEGDLMVDRSNIITGRELVRV